MFRVTQSRNTILLLVLVWILITALLSFAYITKEQNQLIAQTKLTIAKQQTTLSSIALLASKDGADSIVEQIIKDCSPENRALFDEKLSNLSSLRGQELVQIEQLFNACGNFFAERKAVMVARLNREYQVYTDLIAIAAVIDSKSDATEYKQEQWEKLVTMESKRSEHTTKLVEVQGEIIRALKNNITVASDEMQVMLVDAQKTKKELVDVTIQIDSLLQEILSL